MDQALPLSRIMQDRTRNIDVLLWPSKSPDLNPIEHIWDELERRVRQRPHKPITLPELRQALQEEWDNLPQAVISSYCFNETPLSSCC